MNRCLKWLAALGLAAAAWPSFAHKASDAYLQLVGRDGGIELRVDVALRDLDVALDLDADGDGRLTWGEVRRAWPAIEREVLAGVLVQGCELAPALGQALERRSDGAYAVLTLRSPCRPAGEPVLRYTLFGAVDPTHRGLLRIDLDGKAPEVRVLDPTQPGQGDVSRPADRAASASFVLEGIHHIVTGYDHVLFLLCLLLPAVMRREGRTRWRPVDGLDRALWPVVGIVTAFTLAHSVTLALAALKWVSLPASFIEPAIAVTIVLAAVDNLWPIFHGRRALVTFVFGLVHGFGFAGVLGELNLPAATFVWALLQFNLGLELGQLGIVLLAVGLLYLLRGHRRYPAWVIAGGSTAALAVGVLWFVERTADVALLPF